MFNLHAYLIGINMMGSVSEHKVVLLELTLSMKNTYIPKLDFLAITLYDFPFL